MNLNKEHWNENDIKEFQNYLKTFENADRREWATNLLRTNLPVLCIKTEPIKNIIKDISKGNYLEFLDLMIWEYYENTAINGYLINKIKDFHTWKKYMDIYSSKADNWGTTDLLKFNTKNNEKNYFDFALNYIKDEKPFRRRIGMYILFEYINDEYIERIFKLLDCFKEEKEYYVNMMNAWLLCECFIKQRNKTLEYIKNNNLNKFTINKGIQKCRESRRVTEGDKELLNTFKVK